MGSGGTEGGAEAALEEPPSDCVAAQAGRSPCCDCGRLDEDSMSSSSMDFFLRKGLKIRQSGNCRALGCPKRGPALLHSWWGTGSGKTGVSAERETEFDDAKGGVISDTGFCIVFTSVRRSRSAEQAGHWDTWAS